MYSLQEYLELHRTSPECIILPNVLSAGISCFSTDFVFTKKVSGFHIFDRNSGPTTSLFKFGLLSNASLGSCQNCLKYAVIVKSMFFSLSSSVDRTYMEIPQVTGSRP